MSFVGRGRFRDLLVLTRAPLALTAVSDAAAGFALALGTTPTWSAHGALLSTAVLASGSAYLAGMALNDLFDLERDRTLAPHRPLPAGRVTVGEARLVAALLLAVSLGAAAFAGRSVIALWVALVLAIIAYDVALKSRRLLGSFAMGSCRFANLCLAGAFGVVARGDATGSLIIGASGHPTALGSLALGSLAYVTGLTLLSTYEDETLTRRGLVGSGMLLLLGPFNIVAEGLAGPFPKHALPAFEAWLGLGLAAALALLVAWRLWLSARASAGAEGHANTRWLIRGLLLLAGSALCFEGRVLVAFALLSFVVPMSLGARWLFRPVSSDV